MASEQRPDTKQKHEAPRKPQVPLPKPGEFLVHDFRSEQLKKDVKKRNREQPVKLVQWNIERGYKLADVIEELRALDADVLALQEVGACCRYRNESAKPSLAEGAGRFASAG